MAVSVVEPDAIRTSLDATLQHIDLLRRKQEQLYALQIEAEEQLLCRAGDAARRGEMDEFQLAALYQKYAAVAAEGFMARWNEGVGIPAASMQHILRNAPNGPHGTWHGTNPFAGGPVPRDGISVVYVLFDRENAPCYVGSTRDVRERFKRHNRERKPFVRWTAYRCADREAAYQLEERLLSEHKPYLNKKRYR